MGSLVVSAIIPLVVVKTNVIYQEISNTLQTTNMAASTNPTIEIPTGISWLNILYIVYALGCLIMFFRFIRNIWNLRIKSTDEIINQPKLKLVLRNLIEVPHSFLKNIYVPAHKYRSGTIPQVVMDHEKVHVEQRHSLDILLIEILLIFMWFNPLLYLLRYSIKLNHEFLADQKVLENGESVSEYQNTILSFSAHQENRSMVSTINFPIIKKRFTIMKTHTTKQQGMLKCLAAIPLSVLLVIGCGREETVIEPESQVIEEQVVEGYEVIEIHEEASDSIKSILVQAGSDSGCISLKGMTYTYEKKGDEYVFKHMDGTVFDYRDEGFESIEEVVIEEVVIEDLSGEEVIEVLENLTEADIAEYNRLAKKHRVHIDKTGNPTVFGSETKHMQTIWHSMNSQQRATAEPWPYLGISRLKAGELPPPPPPAPENQVEDVPPPPPPAPEIIEVKDFDQNRIPDAKNMVNGIEQGTMEVYIDGKKADTEDLQKIPKPLKREAYMSKMVDGVLYLYFESKYF